jgi:hypothetical protein
MLPADIKGELCTISRVFTLHLRIFVFDEEDIVFFKRDAAGYGIRANQSPCRFAG